MIYGIGIEAIGIERFKKAGERWGERFYKRVFTEGELAYCLKKRSPDTHLSARFAAKISVMKALNRPFGFKDIEVQRDKNGLPTIKLRCAGVVKGVKLKVSITHDAGLSIAEAIAEKGAGNR